MTNTTTATATATVNNNIVEIDPALEEMMVSAEEAEEEAAAEQPYNSHSNDDQEASASSYYCPSEDPTEAAHRRQRSKDRRELGATWTANKVGALHGLRQLRAAMAQDTWQKHIDSVRNWLTLELGLDQAKIVHPLLERALRRGEDTEEAIENRLLRAEEDALLATAAAFGSWTPERFDRFLETRAMSPKDLKELRANIALYEKG